ncbi:MAG: hypothetical protein KC613_00900, partial [Myxococcales bacterium]|nr:hypothetical protein [Myxococcales bacterium]
CDGQVDEAAPCEVPGGRAACEAGACVFQGCDPGRHDADGARANGCEFALDLVLGADLGPATAGPWAASGPAGLAVAWGDDAGQLQLDGVGPRRTVPFDVGRCERVDVVQGPAGAFATCQTSQNQCPVLRSASEGIDLLPCSGPPALTPDPAGLFGIQGDELRWRPLEGGEPELRSRLGNAWQASVGPAAFGLDGAPFAIAYERRERRAQVVGPDGGRLDAVGASLAGTWRQLGVHWLGDGDSLAVVTLVSDDSLVRMRTTLGDLVADQPVDVAGGLLPGGESLGRLSSFEGDDGRLWIMAHAQGVPDGEIHAFIYDPQAADIEVLTLRFPALDGADELAFVRGPAGLEVVFRKAGRARRARLVDAP